MRRIFSIAIIALFIFMGAMLIYPPLRMTVSAFAVHTIGPTATGAVTALVTGILSTVGLTGFAAITMVMGLVGGVLIHFFWVKADWKLRRWGSTRTARDLGVTPVTPIRTTTPTGATTRPAPELPQGKPAPTVEAPVEEEAGEAETA